MKEVNSESVNYHFGSSYSFETWSNYFGPFTRTKMLTKLRPGQKDYSNVFHAQGMWEQAALWAREWRKHISTWGITRVRELYWQPLLEITNWREKETHSPNWLMEIHKYLLLLKITVLLKGEFN